MSDLSERIAATLSTALAAPDVASVLADVQAEATRVAGAHAEIEAEALDPLTAPATVQERRAQCADLEFEAKRLDLAALRLTDALEEAQARDEQARRTEAYSQAADQMKIAGAALKDRGEPLAAELRGLIAAGSDARNAVAAVNNALPQGAKPLTVHPHCERLVAMPERIVSSRTTSLWFDAATSAIVPEAHIRVQPNETIEQLRERGSAVHLDPRPIKPGEMRITQNLVARFVEVQEVTFVPAHRFDWLSGEGPPAQQVRIEGAPNRVLMAG
jgi:hypothetical protein